MPNIMQVNTNPPMEQAAKPHVIERQTDMPPLERVEEAPAPVEEVPDAPPPPAPVEEAPEAAPEPPAPEPEQQQATAVIVDPGEVPAGVQKLAPQPPSSAAVLVQESPVSKMQIVRAAAHVSRLEATKSEEREMARRLAERPDVTAAIDISTAEKRQAEEAETEEAVPKEPELEEEAAQTVPERLADPAYREQLVKDTDPLKAAEDVGGDLGYKPVEIRTLDIEAEQKQEQLDLTEAQAERAVTPTPARMRSLSLSREPEDLPKEPPGPPPVEPKGMKRFAATGAAQTGVALAKLKGSIAERIEEENIGANMAFLRTKTVQQLARQRETKKAGGIAEKLERELAGTETRLAHLDASVTSKPDPPPDFTKIPISTKAKPITKPYRQSDFKYPASSALIRAPLPSQRAPMIVPTHAQSKAQHRRVQALKMFEAAKEFRSLEQRHQTRALEHARIMSAKKDRDGATSVPRTDDGGQAARTHAGGSVASG